MKKLFTLLTMLILGIGSSWADGLKVSTTENANAEYQYKIFCRAASTYYLGNTTNATNSDYGLFAFYAATSDGYTNGYYIYSIFNGKWISYEAKASYTDDDEGQNKITLVDTKAEANPWYITADDTDNKYYDIRAFQSDKNLDASGNASWNWHGGAAANTSNTMGFYDYNNGHSGWGIVLAGGSGSPVADRKVVAIYNRKPNGSEYPITSSVNSSGNVLSSNSTSATPQLFVLRQNGIDSNGEALYNLQKAEGDGKYFSNDATTPKANTYSSTSSNFVFLNTSSPFISNYSAILKDGTSIATSNYNLMARGTYYGCIHSKNNAASFDGWTSNANSYNKIQFYYKDNDWNGLWSVKEQSYTAWQVVITGAAESGSVIYKGTSLLSGATATQSNNGIFVISSASTPTSSDFTINNVDGYLTDPSISFDSDRKLIKVAYIEYATICNTISNFLSNTPEGVGYPTTTARTRLQAAIDVFNASSKVTADLATLNTAYNSFMTNVVLPEGKVYTIQNYIKSPSKTTYLKNESGTLTIGTDASATTLNNLWIVRKSGNNYVLQSAADQTKYIVYNSFTLGATGSTWTLSCGTEWPYISMNTNFANVGKRFVACNGSDKFGTASGSYYANDRTQTSGWSTDFKFVESEGYALYKVKIIYPSGSAPTVTYNETAYSNGADFVAPTTLESTDLIASSITGYTANISINNDIIYVNYTTAFDYADTWNFDNSPWSLLNDTPAEIDKPSRTYRFNTKKINVNTTFNCSIVVKFAYTSGSFRIDVAGVDLLDPSTGKVVRSDYHDGFSGNSQSNREYTIDNVAPGNYILRYISYAQSTSSEGNISVKITPVPGFYRIKNNGTGNYLAYGTPTANGNTLPAGLIATSNNTDAASIIKLTGSSGTYKLSVQGLNIQSQTDANVAFPGSDAEGVDFVFNVSTPGVVSITNAASASATVSYRDGSLHEGTDGWTVHGVINWSASNPNSKWILEDATSCTVNLNSDGATTPTYYATFCAPFSYTVSDGTKAYTLKKSGNYLVPTEVDQVPAGTPVLLKGSSATATLTIGSGYAESPLATTALTGTYVATTIAGGTDYVLGKYEGKVGFYHWNSNNLAANRAYLAAESVAQGARGFALMFEDDATGIVSTPGEIEEGTVIYNLSGQRLNKIQKGINIVNGKKVLF